MANGQNLWFDEDWEASPGKCEERPCVPIREAEAAVRFGAPYFFGFGRAVDSIAGAIETNPRDAHGIIWTRLDDKFSPELFGLRTFREYFGIESVVGIGDNDGYMQFSHWSLFHVAGDADRKVRNDAAVFVGSLEFMGSQTYLELGGPVAEGHSFDHQIESYVYGVIDVYQGFDAAN